MATTLAMTLEGGRRRFGTNTLGGGRSFLLVSIGGTVLVSKPARFFSLFFLPLYGVFL